MGHVSTRIPILSVSELSFLLSASSMEVVSHRTNISGEAPTRYSASPRLIKNPYGDGFLADSRRNNVEGGVAESNFSRKVCERTASNKSPTLNSSFAFRTELVNSFAGVS